MGMRPTISPPETGGDLMSIGEGWGDVGFLGGGWAGSNAFGSLAGDVEGEGAIGEAWHVLKSCRRPGVEKWKEPEAGGNELRQKGSTIGRVTSSVQENCDEYGAERSGEGRSVTYRHSETGAGLRWRRRACVLQLGAGELDLPQVPQPRRSRIA